MYMLFYVLLLIRTRGKIANPRWIRVCNHRQKYSKWYCKISMRGNNILDIYRGRPEFLFDKTRSRGVSVVAAAASSFCLLLPPPPSAPSGNLQRLTLDVTYLRTFTKHRVDNTQRSVYIPSALVPARSRNTRNPTGSLAMFQRRVWRSQSSKTWNVLYKSSKRGHNPLSWKSSAIVTTFPLS